MTVEDFLALDREKLGQKYELKSAQVRQGTRMDAMDSKLDLILQLLQPRHD